jgi:hypothetical protein
MDYKETSLGKQSEVVTVTKSEWKTIGIRIKAKDLPLDPNIIQNFPNHTNRGAYRPCVLVIMTEIADNANGITITVVRPIFIKGSIFLKSRIISAF